MILAYWETVGGTLIEEFQLVKGDVACGPRRADAVIICPQGEGEHPNCVRGSVRRECIQMDDAALRNEDAAGDITGQAEIMTHADRVESFRLQRRAL
jgi:hypothetical protein